jgi:hypothetical protein
VLVLDPDDSPIVGLYTTAPPALSNSISYAMPTGAYLPVGLVNASVGLSVPTVT